MSALTYSHAGAGNPLVNPADDNHVWRAVIVSVVIHVLVVVIYPHLNKVQLPDIPERMEIELFSVKAPAPAPTEQVRPAEEVPPEPPKVTPVQKQVTPTPVPTPKPVLAAPNSDAEYKVQEQPAPKEPAPVKTEAAPAATANTTAQTSESRQSEEPAKETRAATTNPPPVTAETDELTASDTDAWGDYGEQLRSLVNKSKQYPTIAIRRHLEGDVTIVAQFTKGELTNVSLAETSKHVPLDEEAMKMVKKAIQQLGVKESLRKKTFRITIPVSFRLE
jgi:protein TonB